LGDLTEKTQKLCHAKGVPVLKSRKGHFSDKSKFAGKTNEDAPQECGRGNREKGVGDERCLSPASTTTVKISKIQQKRVEEEERE